MKNELYLYDVYPKVVSVGKPVQITIQPLGRQSAFSPDTPVELKPYNDRNLYGDGREAIPVSMTLSPEADGCLRFEYTFSMESEYAILFEGRRNTKMRLNVYAVEADLQGRYPFLGDTHVHSIDSDGRQAPEIVAADYRRQGMDFLAMTDHRTYVGSMHMIEAYKGVDLDLELVPGEEVQLPNNVVHIINFGATSSVNAMVQSMRDKMEENFPGITSLPAERWRGDENAPCYSDEEYEAQVWALADSLSIPEGPGRFTVAACIWAARKIREWGGLSVFCHPYWIAGNAFHIPPYVSDAIFDTNEFDAFELYGGERYMDQNESQLLHYMEAKARGTKLTAIGASDSHGVYNNPGAYIGKTLVLAAENKRTDLIDAMRTGYCVAVECISAEYRTFASLRLARYGRFLLDNYFPLHDELCVEEGRLMKAYVCGDSSAAQELARLKGRTGKLLDKYFAF